MSETARESSSRAPDIPKPSTRPRSNRSSPNAKPDASVSASKSARSSLPRETGSTKSQSMQNATQHDDKNDAQDESEAETLISSPVKKREAQKKVNGIKPEPSEEAGDPTGGGETVTKSTENHRTGNSADKKPLKREAAKIKMADKDDNDTSDMSSARSLSEESDSRRSSRSPATTNDRAHSEGHDQRNPRKRKHRESSMAMEPPRRRRRASTAVSNYSRDKAQRSSEEPSPPPRLRSHKRTESAQPEQDGNDTRGSGRQRRAASHLTGKDAKSSKGTWDSDASSDTSNKHQQGRLIRHANRSVSTPGRSVGRDHKRHVNKYGFTRLAEACESGDLDSVKEWRVKDPEQLEQREFAGNTPLQVASLNGYPDIVQYLLDEGASAHCANTDKDTPLIDAVENGHVDVVRLLLRAGVDPLRQNMKGQQALDVITDETDDGPEIRNLLRKAIEEWTANGGEKQLQHEEQVGVRPGPTKHLQFMARTYDNLLKLVSDNDRSSVQEFLDARVPVDNAVVAAAAKTGDVYLLNMLLAEMSPKKARSRAEKPMLAVIGTSHFEMVKTLTELDQFNPTWRSKANGMTWYEYADLRQGPNWRQERALLHKLYTEAGASDKSHSSPASKRDGVVKRLRSPHRNRESEAEADDTESPDPGRNRRRLMSKKDMRAAASTRRSSSSSAGSASDDASDIPRDKSPTEEPVKPPVRKVGRPRKHSISTQPTEPKTKRLRSGSMKDKQPVVEDSKEKRKVTDSIKHEEAIAEESEKETKRKTKDEAKRNNAEEQEEKKRKAEEQKAEEERKAEAARQEAENKRAEQERRKEEQRQKEEQERLERERKAAARRAQEQEFLTSLPSALRSAVEMQGTDSDKAKFVARHFCPIQGVKGAAIGAAEQNEIWMLSYQAAGLLTGHAASSLLDSPALQSDAPWSFANIPTTTTTHEQKLIMLSTLGSSSLVCTMPSPSDPAFSNGSPPAAEDAFANLELTRKAAQEAHKMVQEDRRKFLSMAGMKWIKVSDFLAIRDATPHPHLSGLDLGVRFDACLDLSPFGGPTTTALPLMNGSAVQVNGDVSMSGTDEAPSVLHGMSSGSDMPGASLTKVAVVVE